MRFSSLISCLSLSAGCLKWVFSAFFHCVYVSFGFDLERSECHIKAGPLSLDAKFVFFAASSQLWIVAIASASVSHDVMYWSVPLPL